MIIEEEGSTFEHYHYIIGVNVALGHRVGYIGIPHQHDYHNIKYNELIDENDIYSSPEYNIDVHGGLTYSGKLFKNIIGADNLYYYGFDCGHLGDKKINPSEMNNLINAFNIDYSIEHYTTLYHMFPEIEMNATEKTIEFVRGECFKLSKQLNDLQK